MLLNYCVGTATLRGVSPWAAWHAIRMNLAAADSLKLRIDRNADHAENRRLRQDVRARLLTPGADRSNLEPHRPQNGRKKLSLFGWEAECDSLIDLGRLFPELSNGCDLLIGNPPYTELGYRNDLDQLVEEYATLRHARLSGNENIYLLFVEMMWRLTKPGHNAASLVVPLSIAYHQGGDYTGCRQAMVAKGSTWRCAFFDREPHVLFGEDVKTRNAILFRRETAEDPERGAKAIIETGPLKEVDQPHPYTLFESVRFTRLASSNISRGIPKLEGDDLSALSGPRGPAGQFRHAL